MRPGRRRAADALAAATAILTALYAFRETLAGRVSAVPGIGHANLNVGLIAGGINTNVVPDKVTFRIDRRMIPEENPQAVEQELRDLIAQAARAAGDHGRSRADPGGAADGGGAGAGDAGRGADRGGGGGAG